MKEYNQEDYLMLSGIQHYVFCKRQWALIHIEKAWIENYHTVIGNIFHEKAHSGINEKRKNIIITRSLPIQSRTLGISGECDVVEFHLNDNGVTIKGRKEKYIPCPIEYKKGTLKKDDSDILQLTAQAMCIEEMFCCNIEHGYLFYGKNKHREKVIFTKELKDKVIKTFQEMHSLFNKGHIPKVKPTKKCDSCSLKDTCLPNLCQRINVNTYINKKICEDIDYEKII